MKKIIGITMILMMGLLASGCAGFSQAPAATTGVKETAQTHSPAASAIPTPSESMTGGQPLSYYLELEPEIQAPFTLDDWTFCGLPFRSKPADVMAVVGEPESTEVVEWDADGSIYDDHYYAFGRLSYQEDKLEIVKVEASGYPGPRGVEVGDSLEEVIVKFYTAYEKADDDAVIFYRENLGRDNFIALPPSGAMWSDGVRILQYCWDDVGKYDGQEISELEGYAPYEANYSFSMVFDENDRMTSYTLFYGAAAE